MVPAVLHEKERRSVLLCLFTWESPFGGVCIHMQYIIHGLYFMKRKLKKIGSCSLVVP